MGSVIHMIRTRRFKEYRFYCNSSVYRDDIVNNGLNNGRCTIVNNGLWTVISKISDVIPFLFFPVCLIFPFHFEK